MAIPYSTLGEMLHLRSAKDPARTALIHVQDSHNDSDLCATYAHIDAGARRLALLLSRLGLCHERALLLFPCGIEFVQAFFGCVYAGVIPVPCARRIERSPALLRAIQRDSGAVAIIAERANLSSLQKRVGEALMSVRYWVELPQPEEPADYLPQSPAIDSVAYLQYTSGSTSSPRGVEVTHRNVAYTLNAIDEGFRHTAESVSVSWLPNFHDMGLVYGVLQPICQGFLGVVLSPGSFARNPMRWLETITRFKATHSGGPNFGYEFCLNKIRPEWRSQLKLDSWRIAFNGAEPVRSVTLERFANYFAVCGFSYENWYPAYGLAEATLKVSGLVTATRPRLLTLDSTRLQKNEIAVASSSTKHPVPLVGCGRPVSGTTVKIVDPEQQIECPEDRLGEIWVCGPGVAAGYWGRQAETHTTFRARIKGVEDRFWMRTGDLGFLCEDELYVIGRLKDMIIVRGQNLFAEDIELAISISAPVATGLLTAAFSIDVENEERMVIVQELTSEVSETKSAAAQIRNSVIGDFEVECYAVVFVHSGEIPRTTSGKIARQACKEKYLARNLRIIAEYTFGFKLRPRLFDGYSQPKTVLLNLAASILGLAPERLTTDLPLVSLGLTSLLAADLARLMEERTGLQVGPEDLLQPISSRHLFADLTQRVSETVNQPSADLASVSITQPLGMEQKRIYFLDCAAGGEPAFNIGVKIKIFGPLDVDRLLAAANAELLETSACCSGFLMDNDEPRQNWVIPTLPKVEVIDWGKSQHHETTWVHNEIRRLMETPFDLSQPPLIRGLLATVAPESYLFALAIHHIVSDAQSLVTIFRRIVARYEDTTVCSVSNFPSSEVESNIVDGADIVFWRDSISRIPMRGPSDSAHALTRVRSLRSQQSSIKVDIEQAVSRASEEVGCTPFVFYLAAFASAVRICMGREKFVVACPVDLRQCSGSDRIGLLSQPIPLVLDLSETTIFKEILITVRNQWLQAYAHRRLSFAQIIEIAKEQGVVPGALMAFMFTILPELPPIQAGGCLFEPRALHPSLGYTTASIDLGREAGEFMAHASIDVHGLGRPAGDILPMFLRIIQGCAADISANPAELAVAIDVGNPHPTGQFELDSDHNQSRGFVVHIASTYPAIPVRDALSFGFEYFGAGVQVSIDTVDQIFPRLLDGSSPFFAEERGVNVVLFRPRHLKDTETEFVSAVLACATKSHRSLILCCNSSGPEWLEFDREFFCGLRVSLSGTGIILLDDDHVAQHYPVDKTFTPDNQLLDCPYTDEKYAAIGYAVARRIDQVVRQPYKVVAIDCDGTLWTGTCGEDGAEGVGIDTGRIALQQKLVQLKRHGFLLVLCSRNNERDVRSVFERRFEMELRPEHISKWAVDWESKPNNLCRVASQFGVALDSFIFLDDDPEECARMKAMCPKVTTIQVPAESRDIGSWLNHIWPFDAEGATNEDTRRADLYAQSASRQQLLETGLSLKEWIEALNLTVEMGEIGDELIARVSQLSRRTNQFNTSLLRLTEAELRAALKEPDVGGRVIRARDRFGDYGVVGAFLFKIDGEALRIFAYFLSCRALSRGIEYQALHEMAEIARQQCKQRLWFSFVPGDRNQPALEFLKATCIPEESVESIVWEVTVEQANAAQFAMKAPNHNTSISSRALNDSGLCVLDYNRIAAEGDPVPRFIEHLARKAPTIPRTPNAGRPPRTETEAVIERIWADALGLEVVDVEEDFFALGGHSLLAMKMFARIRERFQLNDRRVSFIEDLLAVDFTVASLATWIDQRISHLTSAQSVS